MKTEYNSVIKLIIQDFPNKFLNDDWLTKLIVFLISHLMNLIYYPYKLQTFTDVNLTFLCLSYFLVLFYKCFVRID